MSAASVTIHALRPGSPTPRCVRVHLEDVVAANTLVITFDPEEAEWVIESPTVFRFPAGYSLGGEKLETVARIPAWSDEAVAALEADAG